MDLAFALVKTMLFFGTTSSMNMLSLCFVREQAVMDCQWYRFKPTLHDDMARADVVVSHAGAGSVMEALGKGLNTWVQKLHRRPAHTNI